MQRHVVLAFMVVLASITLVAGAALGQTFNSGSTGADGAINIGQNQTVTLQVPPSGVFNFTTITISTNNGWLKFTKNATNTPVTMLASGNVTLGNIDVSGVAGGNGVCSAVIVGGNGGAGGAGGFDGGTGATQGANAFGGTGRGPGGGGGATNNSGGGGAGFLTAGSGGTTYQNSGTPGAAGALYGDQTLLPLIGGSGGGGGGATPWGNSGGGGGGGGGALLIASSGTITFSGGSILGNGAIGGNSCLDNAAPGGPGSGGSVRLVATTITGSGGTINVSAGGQRVGNASSGTGSSGRVRIEAYTNTLSANFPWSIPTTVSTGPPTSVTLANAPTLAITSIGGVSAPGSPTGSFAVPDVILPVSTTNPVTVALAATNIPVGTVISVTVNGQTGGYSSTLSSALSGTTASSTATASIIALTTQPFVVSASATFAVSALQGEGPLYANGEPVDRVKITATQGGRQRVAFITRSGREVPVSTPVTAR